MKKIAKSAYFGMEATTTNKDWGYIPVPCKGGDTTNAEIPEWMFNRELEDLKGGAVNA